MSANKTLVAYASKGGATEEAAQIVADVLRSKFGLEAELVDLRKSSPETAQYGNIVVGAGVRGGKVYGEALDFLKKGFGNRKVAFFVCCGAGGDPKNYDKVCTQYLNDTLAKYPKVNAVASEIFGGRMKILGKTVFDNRDTAKIRAWAERLGKKLTD